MPSDYFGFTMPGQPPSWNHMYRWTTKRVGLKEVRIQVLTDEANLYKRQLTMVAQAAKPSDFQPKQQVLVYYDMHLGRNLDADNVMKAINDALAIAIGVDDKMFLPSTSVKTIGNKNPKVHIYVYDATAWAPRPPEDLT